MRRRVLNEMLVVLYKTRQGVSAEPLVFNIPCGNRLSFPVPPDHRSSLRYDKGGLTELRDWYNARSTDQRDWQLGEIVGSTNGRPNIILKSINSFSDLDGFRFQDKASLEKALEEGFQLLAYSICRRRARPFRVNAYSRWQYVYKLLRHYCIVEMDVYQATNIRARMRDADFGTFMNDANQAVAQSADGWATVKATVRRAGTYAAEDVVVRDVRGIRTVYMKLGLADFTVQTRWEADVQRADCDRRSDIGIELVDEYEEEPARPDEPDKPPELGELDEPEEEEQE
jgi:hypothetical protein